MSNINFDANYEIGFVNGVQFGVYSPEMILKKSVVHVNVETYYDSNGDPRIGGLFDPRMGYIEPRLKCKTCNQTYINCPGHFGHIELPKPVFNIQFEDAIMKILQCVCIKCSRLLVNKNHPIIKNIIASTKGHYKDRFEKIYKLCQKAKICGNPDKKGDERFDNGGCGAIQPNKYNKKDFRTDYIISAEWKNETGENPINMTQILNAEIVLAIFKRISDDDALVMGFNSKWCLPSWLIITILPVVPPSVRPSVRQYNSQRSEDDLTNKYYDIIKYCQMLNDRLNKGVNISPEVIKQFTDYLQHSVITLFNNEIKNIPQALTRGGRPMKTLRQRLSGKEGRIRSNLMGKRVDFSARSVISPDANLDIEDLGVPFKIAMNLTFPERVNKYNINRLYQFVRNGDRIYPGAKSIKYAKDGSTRITDVMDPSKIVLNYGDIVNRHLINGDIVLFNRQPSLHKMSMMAHRVRVMDGLTFRLNVDVCKPYNADFDGDEMNMHVSQSIQTAVELKYLANVSKMIISPSENQPIISPAQDNLLGLFKITDDTVFFSQQEFMNLMVGIKKFNGILPDPVINDGKIIRWSGKQAYSIILPPITFYRDSDNQAKYKNLIIEDGILKQGQIEKKASTQILHIIYNDYGHKEAARYLNDLQRIITRYMLRSGFSVGISDLIVPNEIRKKNEEIILQGKKEVVELTKKMHLNILEDITTGLDKIYDNKIESINAKTEKAISKSIIDNLTMSNRINYIVTSGSKGGDINIQQMMCLVGPQSIDGQKKVPMGFTDRTLPHYPRYENGAESRGFITSNFLNGLNPQEFFFHAMAGREGVIDTAVKTANSGYLQRKLIKSMEDLKVGHDLTVRSSNNDIVQFCYGYDGFNSTDLELQKNLDFAKITIEKLNDKYYIDINEKFDYIQSSELIKMKKIDGWKNIIATYNKNIERVVDDFHRIYTKFGKISDVIIYYPINFNRLILNTSKHFKLSDAGKTDIHIIEIINEINKLIEFCSINKKYSLTCEILIWNYLAPKILLRDKKFNRVAFLNVINSVKSRFKHSLAEGGEMVGPLAAQSLGEKTTQMTLHTFHLAGVGEKSAVTTGVPRLKEILDNTKNPKISQVIIYLDEQHRFNHEMAEKVANNIELTTVGDVLESTAIYLEPNNEYDTVLEEDREFMEIYKVFSELDTQALQIANNPWLIRLEFDRRKIIDKKITMEDINLVLKNTYPQAFMMFMDDNASKLVFRLRMNFQHNPEHAYDDITYLEDKIKEISDIVIKGVDGISNVYTPNQNENMSEIIIKENGSYISKPEFSLTTTGTNLFDILIRKGVDPYRTYSNDPNEMYSIFGIEAARHQIQNQLNIVLNASGVKQFSPRHLDLLCDKMCQNGEVMSINRHGLKKENIGPLAKASFEETTDQLLDASLFGEFDNIKGVSSNIMVGQIPNCGTGDSILLLDEDMLNTQENIEITKEEDNNINQYFETSEYCQASDIKFSLSDIKDNNTDYDNYIDVDVEIN
jgi:DNA-directed RNA polymerase II subunit RPB1